MKLTLQQRTSRMQNLKAAENTKCGRRMYIRNYLPGFAVYDAAPACDASAFENLKALAEAGVDVLLLPSQALDRKIAKKFTQLCHYFELRVLFTVSDWEAAPSAQWRYEKMPRILQILEECGFDGIFADMSRWTPESSTAHDPQLEDMLWQLYTYVHSRGGILVLRTRDGQEPPCIDQVYDYLMVSSAVPMLQTQGFVLPEKADSFAAAIPFLQLPLLTRENEKQWQKYRTLYAPMVQNVMLAYLDIQACADIVSTLPAGVHGSMFVGDVKYLAVANLSGEPYTLKLKEQWTDRVTQENADTFAVQPGQLLMLAK
mgnify:CR=1 FL=1